MAEWYSLIDGYLELGIDWAASTSNTQVSIAPKVYRWDEYNTDNYGGRYDESLSPDPTGAGYWSGLTYGSGSGTREIDSFETRTYSRGHSAQTVALSLAWSNTGSWYDGSFHYASSGSHTWYLTIPAKPSYSVTYNANGGSGAPSSQTKWYGETLTLSSTVPTRTGYTFLGWSTSSSGSVMYSAGASYTSNSAISLYAIWKVNAPAAPTSCSNSRSSDSKNVVTWTNGASSSITYESVKLERSIDGGSWSEIASLAPASVRYEDVNTSPDHSYRYRVRAYNSTGYSAYATSGTTYNTPAKPPRISAARTSDTHVLITLAGNASNTATVTRIERSTDGTNWTEIGTTTGVATSYEDDPGGGSSFWYRACNVRSGLASGYASMTESIATICKPNPPTLMQPVSGAVISTDDSSITFKWSHNPLDGSGQTAAKLQYKVGAGSYTTVNVSGSAQQVTVSNVFSANSAVTWRVCTKGAHADYSDYSDTRSFNVYQKPTVSFAQPPSGYTLTTMPLSVALQYIDVSGSLASATLTIRKGGAVAYTLDMGTSTQATIQASDFLPDNMSDYVLEVSVRSTSKLTASASITVHVDYLEPAMADARIEADEDTGYVRITVYYGHESGLEDTVRAELFRVADGIRVQVASAVADGQEIVDRYAPLNCRYSYEVVSYTEASAFAVSAFDGLFETGYMYMYSGDEVFRSNLGVKLVESIELPEKVRKHCDGRRFPVSGNSKAVDDAFALSLWMVTRGDLMSFRRIMLSGGRCVVKTRNGLVFHADITSPSLTISDIAEIYATASMTLNRIDGGEL